MKGSGSLNADIALVKFSTKAKKNEKNDLHADLMHTLKAINDRFPGCPHEVSYRVAQTLNNPPANDGLRAVFHPRGFPGRWR